MNRSLFLAAAGLAALAAVHTGRAAQSQPIDTENGSGIAITVSRVFDNTPPGGAAPVHLNVTNRSGETGTWTFTTSRYMSGGSLTTQTEVTVGPGESRSVPFIAFLGATMRGNNVNVHATGPAVQGGGNAYLQHSYNGNAKEMPFLAMSRDLAARSWEPLKKHIETAKWTFDATQFDPADLLDDWRAYAGVGFLALSDTEWAKLPASVRTALRQWVSMGGRLIVASNAPASIDWSGARASTPAADGVSYGFGVLGTVLWDGKELKPEALAPLVMKEKGNDNSAYDENKSWSMLANLGSLKPNAPLILGFVIAFATLVGPVNLFLLAPPARRHRMFWTTPLIAVGGSLLLIVVITFQEGTGGTGRRFTAIQLLPSAHEAAVIQDQVARTGLLFAGAFRLPEDVLPSPLRLDLPFQSQENGTYRVAGRNFSGNWFKSRSLQAQRFAAIRPTRAELTVVSRDAASGTPSIVSSIESPLETLFLTGSNGRLWRADNVRPGEKTAMHPAALRDRTAWATVTLGPARPQLNEALKNAAFKEGRFAALVSHPKGEMMASLSSLRWKDDRVFYTGPVTESPATGAPQP
ncbi:MAG: hypothetical protein PHQ12_03350 [Chthoniobacteraceae bacterium]|nr:hypothetical protein [Chthoniobacteraceae bacterium]